MHIKNKISILGASLVLMGCQTPSLQYAKNDALSIEKTFSIISNEGSNVVTNEFWWQEGLNSQDKATLMSLLSKYPKTQTSAQLKLRVEQAIENKKMTASNFLPKADLQWSANKNKTTSTESLGLNFSYSPGLLGVKEFSEMLSNFDVFSSEISRGDGLLTWQNQVYVTYFQLKSIQARIFFLEKNLSLIKENIELIKNRVEFGFSTKPELDKQVSVYIDYEATLNSAKSVKLKYVQSLLTLIGRSPENEKEIELFLMNFDFSTPDQLSFKDYFVNKNALLQRTDVQQAKLNLLQSAAKKEASDVAGYPQLSLSSGIGFSSSGKNFNLSNFGWNLAAMLIAPVLDGGKLKAQENYYSLEYSVALSKYSQTLDKAIQDVTMQMDALVTALNQYNNLLEYKVAIASQKNQILSKFMQGMQSKIITNDNLRVLSQYELNAIDYQYSVYLNWANLNAAVGYTKSTENNINEK